MLRLAMIFVSLMAHAALALPFVLDSGERSDALDLGSGNDQIRIEVGLPSEGVISTGQDEITTAALDTSPIAASAARQEIKKIEAEPPPEVKPLPEEPPPEQAAAEPPPPLKEPPPEAMEVKEPEPQPLEPPPELPVAAEPVDLPPPADPVEPLELAETRPPELADLVTSDAPEVAESVAPPPVASIAPPEILERRDEVVELKPDTEIPQLEQAAADAQIPQIPVQELVAAGAKQDGGEAYLTARKEHLAASFDHISSRRFQVLPRRKPDGNSRGGSLWVRVHFKRNGDQVSREILESSSDPDVDEAAYKWLDKAGRFPPFPDAIPDDKLFIDIPFRFTVR